MIARKGAKKMKIKSKHKIKTTILFYIFIFCFLSGSFLNGSAGQMESPIFLNINNIKEHADLVLIGNLEPVAPPYEVLGKDFYKMSPREVLKGEVTENSLLVVITNVDSSEGRSPIIEPELTYMLFLQRMTLEDQAAPSGLVFSRLVGNWKGIISLDRKASETRSVNAIKKQYGIEIQASVADFIAAMRCSLSRLTKIDLSSEAIKIYQSLGLNR
jgi:hypothetical protein